MSPTSHRILRVQCAAISEAFGGSLPSYSMQPTRFAQPRALHRMATPPVNAIPVIRETGQGN
jgi:hypothetical protein